jgi:copper(I)-binding protein
VSRTDPLQFAGQDHRIYGESTVDLRTFLALAASLLTVAAAPRPALSVTGAWTRPTAIAGLNAAGYLTLVNRGAREERLIAASSPVAQSVTLHRSARVGQVMTMRQVAFIAVPAHASVPLSPGGYHLMLEHLRRPLRLGETVSVRLRFADGGTLPATLAVRSGGGAMPGMAM